MTVETKRLTYEEFLELPETNKRYDVIDGELLYMSPGPNPKHQRSVLSLSLKLAPVVKERNLGELFIAPLDVLIRRSPLRTRQPDLLFISRDRLNLIGEQMIEGSPDLVVEILSPSNTRSDLVDKLADYWSIGVQECWLVSIEARTVEVLGYAPSAFLRSGLFGLGDLIRSEVLPNLLVKVDEIW
jgi:Uma2 family endonuclease